MYTNPLAIPGTIPLRDAEVTSGVTARAIEILKDQRWPMFAATGVETIDGVDVIARVEWHPPEPSINHWHRGVTFYKVSDSVLPEGIDLSGYQKKVDWTLVGQTKKFCFMKASEGLHTVDEMFEYHYAGAAANGLFVGAYHFFHPELDGIEQAKHFLSVIGSKTLHMPPVIDVEVAKGIAPAKILDGVLAWIAEVKRQTGRSATVYTMPSFWDTLPATILDGSASLDYTADLWVAHWKVTTPRLPNDWSAWRFWQYESEGGCAGIATPMDVNRFNGTQKDLELYCSGLAAT